MTCDLCKDTIERIDIPHVIRICQGCGRELHIVELGDHGRGIKINAGERVVIPSDWLKLSLNPLKSTGSFTRDGLQWFAEKLFVEELFVKEKTFQEELSKFENYVDEILRNSQMITGLDINNVAHAEKIFEIVKENKGTNEWWALWGGIFISAARDAFINGQTNRALWAMACAERCRAMLLFKEQLEEVVWMGHSAKRVIDILKVWDGNQQNSDEQFWQLTFNENTYVLSQIFAVPVVFIKDKAYVGGTKMDGSESRFVDYIFSAESSREAILIEIKTPTAKILGGEYRNGIYPPSNELSGAVVQVLRYRNELVRNLQAITEDRDYELAAFSPKCVLLIGNATSELIDINKRRSFEIYRGNLRDVEIVTYDELFRKVEVLANLFHLIRTKSNNK